MKHIYKPLKYHDSAYNIAINHYTVDLLMKDSPFHLMFHEIAESSNLNRNKIK
jgi:hypothetical protein